MTDRMSDAEYCAISRHLHPLTGKPLLDGDVLEAIKDRDEVIAWLAAEVRELSESAVKAPAMCTRLAALADVLEDAT